MRHSRSPKPRPPLDAAGLERLAIFYAGRYATTRAKLRDYLLRKVRERGWQAETAPDVDGLVERFVRLGYVDDRAFAQARAASLQRRGLGERRLSEALRAAGIRDDDAADARASARAGAWEAALRFAQRKRLGPFSQQEHGAEARQKAFAAMVRAGHPLDIVRRIVRSKAGEVPNPDEN